MQDSSTVQLRVENVSLVPRIFTKTKAAALVHVPYLLQDISFEVFRGDLIAILGASGAGKTLLLRLLNRLAEPTSGRLYLENRAYSQIPPVELRQQVVLVLQESKLLGMTVQETLEYPLTLRQLSQKTIQQRLALWMERLNLPSDWLNRTELQLSVGQRQLVAIARALIIQPKILLLDEPTSALDVGRAQTLLQVLADLAQTEGMTIVMANHQLELAEQFCDRVLHLQQGILQQDRSANQINWTELRQTLIQAEKQQAAEWE